MPRRKYTPEQKALLTGVEKAHAEIIHARATLRAKIEAAFEDKMTDLELKESRAMNDAERGGVAKTDIGRAIGTSNWGTIQEKLARTAGDVRTEDLISDPLAARYSFDAGRLYVTLTGSALADALAAQDYPADAVEHDHSLTTAEFDVVTLPHATLLDPITNDWQPKHQNRHPVVAWAGVPANGAEALAWYGKHAPKTEKAPAEPEQEATQEIELEDAA